jgi:copper(I)-binding protein
MRIASAVALLLLASCKVSEPPAISVEDPWVRATVPGQTSSAAYFTIFNSGGADKLIAVSATGASASLHSTSIAGGVMRMRLLQSLDIPADSTVALDPGGIHIMLSNLRQPLSAGDTIRLQLKFEKSGERPVDATVRPGAMPETQM